MIRIHLAAFLMNATVAIGLAGLGVHEVNAESQLRAEMTASVETEVTKVYMADQIECLAKNIYFEARDQSFLGQRAVAWVTLNRVHNKKYPKNICDVVWQYHQFSWTHDGKSDNPGNNFAWHRAMLIAEIVLDRYGDMDDPTDGAVMFHANYVDPYWNSKYTKTVRIDDHIFYKEVKKKS